MKRSPFAARQAALLAVCKTAVQMAGGPTHLSRKLGLTSQGRQWKAVPPRHVLAVEQASGISRFILRPDVYGKAPKTAPEENGVPA
jgi:DNA-binding transcriptional regulator YdaS (Cro superfamily)